jgi:sugar phosphate isomerase/epimerase
MKIAAQLYTLRDFTGIAEGFRDALRRCSEIGYQGVQLSAVGCMNGPSPTVNAQTAKEWLDEFGLACCATHRPWTSLLDDIGAEIKFHQTLDCKYLALGSIGNEFGQQAESYEQFLEASKPVALELAAHGIKFGYHNHAHEFARNQKTGQPCMAILTNPANDWLQMEIDTYWVAEAGVCPADLLADCIGRIWAVHLKDREIIPGAGPVMAPVGSGNLNWDSILRVCHSGGAEWLIVEQDVCRTDPFDCLASSFRFLSEVL